MRALLAFIVLAGCSGTSDPGSADAATDAGTLPLDSVAPVDTSVTDADLASIPACVKATTSFEGTIDGVALAKSIPRGTNWSFVNGGSFFADLGSGGYLKMQFEGTVLDDQIIATRGILVVPKGFPAEGSYCFGDGSILRHDAARTVSFVLKSITRGATCDGPPVTGTVAGCSDW